ncbi:MAG: YggS family pyridoxal phosphate-dependent enzyme [Kangiellaceae bacterium]|jgi:pyridoxal phosphate enzyme (YggS family)|nr:YggS family pyridoxal phosphate-dependent enzyme [Kangiellaceae bacterium]
MSVTENLTQIKHAIELESQNNLRDANSVTLLAVSKAQEINKIDEAYLAGQRLFGESYLSEALPKIAALKHRDICWHFIGPIQSNKTKDIAAHFDWVQSVDRVKIARRLNDQRPAELGELNITLQLNLANEPTKQGFTSDQLGDVIEQIIGFDKINLRGFMSIPVKYDDAEKNQRQFEQIAATYRQYQQQLPSIDTLSIGMSGDWRQAIAAGSTMIRLGTALFGKRPANWKKS